MKEEEVHKAKNIYEFHILCSTIEICGDVFPIDIVKCHSIL